MRFNNKESNRKKPGLHKKCAALAFEMLNFLQNKILRNVKPFGKAGKAEIRRASPVYELFISSDFVERQVLLAVHAAAQGKSTTFARKTAQS